jgi:hypothetical protein
VSIEQYIDFLMTKTVADYTTGVGESLPPLIATRYVSAGMGSSPCHCVLDGDTT